MHTLIIGNGISGVSAARHIRKRSGSRVTVISKETDHFFSRTALMYIYMGHMKFEHTKPYEDGFWKKNKIELLRAKVNGIDYAAKTVELEGNKKINYDKLIIATGSKTNKFGWPGQDLPGVQGLYSYQDLELLEKNTHPPFTKPEEQLVKEAVIVGGGLIGIELAEMLLTRNVNVTFLVREKAYWDNVLPLEESKLVMRHMAEHHVSIKLSTELDSILAGSDGRVSSVTTKSGETISCQLVGLTAGVSPNIDFLKGAELELGRGILVNHYLETNIPDVYAVGDCVQFREAITGRRPIEQVWYTGRMMGETVAQTIAGNRTKYKPGYWFNSAKFFDIEYQTYGTVLPKIPTGQSSFYWEDNEGSKCIRLVFDKKTEAFIGLNSFGIRLRHELFDKWLIEKRDVDFIVANLRDANFDPEFYKSDGEEIVSSYNNEFSKNVRLKKKSWSRIFSI